jgi:hypothetical protein
MTPLEKAKELFNKIVVYHWTDVCDYEGAKQCTLIAVNEIINFSCYMMPEVKESMMDYLDEVKQEINNL